MNGLAAIEITLSEGLILFTLSVVVGLVTWIGKKILQNEARLIMIETHIATKAADERGDTAPIVRRSRERYKR